VIILKTWILISLKKKRMLITTKYIPESLDAGSEELNELPGIKIKEKRPKAALRKEETLYSRVMF
jgi:hypothetical protein